MDGSSRSAINESNEEVVPLLGESGSVSGKSGPRCRLYTTTRDNSCNVDAMESVYKDGRCVCHCESEICSSNIDGIKYFKGTFGFMQQACAFELFCNVNIEIYASF